MTDYKLYPNLPSAPPGNPQAEYHLSVIQANIVTPALVVFEGVVSGALKNGVIDEEEFNTLQKLHFETLNELMGVDRRMEAENR